MTEPATSAARRPIASRDSPWAKAVAASLGRTAVQPNWISSLSVVFAAVAGYALWRGGVAVGAVRVVCFLGAAACMQLRLICNLLDGMIAVEGGKGSRTGEIWNDLPDRFSDVLIFAPVGYSLPWPYAVELGWVAATLAVLTAYVRMTGGAMALKQDFGGVMGKPQRMAVMTVACVLACLEPLLHRIGYVVAVALLVVAIGSAVTMVTRLRRIAAGLNASAGSASGSPS